MPHVVSLGYCLLHLKLNNDEKWEITPEFVRDSKSNTDAQVIIPAQDYYWAMLPATIVLMKENIGISRKKSRHIFAATIFY